MTDCELCFMNPPWEATEDGELTFPPVPEALPNDTLCLVCREQADAWARDAKKHQEENHQAPWEYNCDLCLMTVYAEGREKDWQAHLAKCRACQDDAEDGYIREAHRDNC